MARIELKFKNRRVSPMILVDGNVVTLKKEKRRLYSFDVPADKGINLKIIHYNELLGKHWFGWFLLFYFIGLFGLFSPRYNKRPFLLNYEANVQVEQDVTISINSFKEKVLDFSRDSDKFDNETNQYIVEKKIKKRMHLVRLFKFLTILIYTLTILILFFQNN